MLVSVGLPSVPTTVTSSAQETKGIVSDVTLRHNLSNSQVPFNCVSSDESNLRFFCEL